MSLISVAHLDLAILAHSSLQKRSKSFLLQGHLLCTALFRSPHRCSIWFSSGLWLGHSKTLIFFRWSHAFVDLNVCFSLLSCWKVKFLFIFSFLTEAWRFCAKIDCYLELFIIPSTLTKALVPAEEKQPQSMMLPPPCFTVGMVFFGWCAVFFLQQTYLLELWPKCLALVLSDHYTFSCMLSGDFMYVFEKFCRAWMFFFVRKGFRLATLPHNPNIWRIWEIVVTCST